MPRARQLLATLVLAALLISAWRALLGVAGWRADFAESNYQANMIRLERLLLAPRAPTVVLAGSSLTGRLLPAAFTRAGVPGVGNLGLDGSTPLVAVEVLARRRDLPRFVFVETHLLDRPWLFNDEALIQALESPGFRLAGTDPLFRAENRPSTLLYDRLRRSRAEPKTPAAPTAPDSDPGREITPSATATAIPTARPAPAAPADAALFGRWTAALRVLRERGTTVILLDLPAGDSKPRPPRLQPDTGDRLKQVLALDRFDLCNEVFARGLKPRYTDGLHLDSGSAEAVAGVLAGRLKVLLATP